MSSKASIITLSNKQIEGEDSEGTNTVPCPLQNYLFGSLTVLVGTGVEAKKERTSFRELFKRNLLHDDPSRKYEESDKEARGRYVTRFMKKMLKNFHSATSSSTLSSKSDAVESISIKRKLSKVSKLLLTLLRTIGQDWLPFCSSVDNRIIASAKVMPTNTKTEAVNKSDGKLSDSTTSLAKDLFILY
ncbi:unnamed protein product [Fraxinus pennsylvanica]|uniref:Uncharacterized protein n=1 Tax=Fraxinus pennsylvanica TaxID=56036 RepID=A0AAD2DX22_9LAMI|nr:unnamed protein product [Fraxinus pennsylvanica]